MAYTVVIILCAVIGKAVLTAWLRKKGWWPDWEKLDEEKQQEKSLLRAYRVWRKGSGRDRASDLRVVCDEFAQSADDVGTLEDRSR